MANNMTVAFLLNLFFSVFELVGGFLTGSISIASDAIHDLGDAVSIGISCFLEKKSQLPPDGNYTYGYRRYSVLAGLFSTVFLLVGSLVVVYHAVLRFFHPVPIHYSGMIGFAVVGVLCNGAAAFVTRHGDSVNKRAVNLHMLEDVLGWLAVLIGAIVMKFTGFSLIDPILSILVAGFILVNALKNLGEIFRIFLVKTPRGISVEEVREHLMELDGVLDVHHIHLWSMDGVSVYATMHLVTEETPTKIKEKVRHLLSHHGISHVTMELEAVGEPCAEPICQAKASEHHHCHHHHHHH